jgi:MarR family 2-MHQ and catechol resistance regulon transcriptional repressor
VQRLFLYEMSLYELSEGRTIVEHEGRGSAAEVTVPTAGPCEGTDERFRALMRSSGQDLSASRSVIALLRADGRVGRAFEHALAASGVTESQFNVLMELAANGGRLPQCDLARGLLKSPANVTALIDRMERDGMVRRVRGERDRRTVMAEITDRGWDALHAAAPAVFEAERKILVSLSDADRANLARLLELVASEATQAD